MNYLFADTPSPLPGELGTVLLSILVILLLFERALAVISWIKPRNEDLVKRSELDEVKAQLASFVTRIELQRLEQQLNSIVSDHKELVKDTSQRHVEFNRVMGDVRLSIEAVRREIREENSKLAKDLFEHIDTLANVVAGQSPRKIQSS